jgi:hypothetical protein
MTTRARSCSAAPQFDRSRCRLVDRLKEVIQVGLATANVSCSRPEGSDSFTACTLRQGAVLEGGEVALNGGLDLRQFTGPACELAVDPLPGGPTARLCALGGFLEEVGALLRSNVAGSVVCGFGGSDRAAPMTPWNSYSVRSQLSPSTNLRQCQ